MKPYLLLFSALSCLVLAPAARAAGTKPAADLVTVAAPEKPSEPVTISVEFPGGSISKLIESIAKVDGVSLNLIPIGDASDFARVELPPFSLRNVKLFTVIEVLGTFLEPRGFALRPVGSGSPNSFVCMLRRIEPPAAPKRAAPAEFVSFQLAPYLAQQSVDDIVGAIRAGWELDPAHDRDALKLKFHPGTSVLLVSGPNDALRLTESIIRQLKRLPDPVPKPDPAHPVPPDAEKK
jgi:hypothetical protein